MTGALWKDWLRWVVQWDERERGSRRGTTTYIIVDICPAHKMPDENAHFQHKTYYSQNNKEQLRGFV